MDFSWLIWLIPLLLVVWGVVLYNRLVSLKQTRRNAFADIDVQLKVRHDLIPNLVETVRGYATHEAQVFDTVTQARASAMRGGSVQDRAREEAVLGQALMQLNAVAEQYPDLKASANFQSLQAELSDVENKIGAARRFFNNATNEYNTLREQFPASVVARMGNFPPEEFFDVGADERTRLDAPPAVRF